MLETWIKTLGTYAILVIAGMVGAIGDVCLNYWVKTHKSSWLVIAFALWLTAVSAFLWLLKCEWFAFGAAVVLGLLIHSILAVVLDRMCFGGRFTPWQWTGFICAVAAIILFGLPTTHSGDSPNLSSAQLEGVDQP